MHYLTTKLEQYSMCDHTFCEANIFDHVVLKHFIKEIVMGLLAYVLGQDYVFFNAVTGITKSIKR